MDVADAGSSALRTDSHAPTASSQLGPMGSATASAAPVLPQRFTVTVEGHGTATATSEERVLVALERAQGFGRLKGLPRKLPVGCRRGGCGICRARVLEGDYRVTPMSRTHVSEAEEAEGVVLSCAIYALTDLTLRLETPVLGKAKGQTAEKS
jgi:ferredoxin